MALTTQQQTTVEKVQHYLERDVVGVDVVTFVTSVDSLSDVVLFADEVKMSEKGYSSIQVSYTDEEGYQYTMVGGTTTKNDMDVLLGYSHVDGLVEMGVIFGQRATKESMLKAENKDLFIPCFS